MVILYGRKQRGTGEKSDLRFTECHLDVVNVVLLEETKDVLRGLERDVAGGGVFLDSDPNGDATGHRIFAAVRSILFPTKADEVDGGEQDLSLVEAFANLRTNVSPQNYASGRSRTLSRIVAHRLSTCPCLVGRGPRLQEAV
jgi:hypothetical protein